MIENGQPFLDGTYHNSFTAALNYGSYDHGRLARGLRRSYHFAMEMIEKNGWQKPLDLHVPNVLLLGTASATTSKAFVEFVHEYNPNSLITIADLSLLPLVASAASELCDNPRVEFAQVDARRLSNYFLPNTFDQIETDGFLKFFPDAEKALVLQQMYEALVPGGVLTTREGLTDPDANQATNDAYQGWLWHVRSYGAPVYPTSKQTMWQLLGEAGFSRTMERRTMFGYSKHITHIVARKPLKKY